VKPSVLQVFKYYYPHIGGVEKVAQDIAEGLKKEVYTEVLTCHDERKDRREEVNGIPVYRAGTMGTYFSVPLAPQFPILMRKMAMNKDILHFHLPFPLGDVSYLLAGPRKRIVVWWHSDIVRPKHLYTLYRPLLRRFLERVDRVIVAAPQLRDYSPVLAEFASKCEVVPIGIDPARFSLTRSLKERSEEIRLKERMPIILFIGRLIYYKGIEFLIGAMKDVEAKLIVIGEGPLGARLESLTESLSLTDRVQFLGRLENEEIPAYLHAAQVFVLPSIANTEAFGIVQLEAMACGTPVVSTNLSTGVPFVNQDGITGIVVPPGDSGALSSAINRLLSDHEMRMAYGENGKERVRQHFTRELMLERILSVYRELAD
jgi:glycosyltransferase involved in cell wall biosynthesis